MGLPCCVARGDRVATDIVSSTSQPEKGLPSSTRCAGRDQEQQPRTHGTPPQLKDRNSRYGRSAQSHALARQVTIDGQQHAGDGFRLVRRQEHGRASDVPGIPHLLHGAQSVARPDHLFDIVILPRHGRSSQRTDFRIRPRRTDAEIRPTLCYAGGLINPAARNATSGAVS